MYVNNPEGTVVLHYSYDAVAAVESSDTVELYYRLFKRDVVRCEGLQRQRASSKVGYIHHTYQLGEPLSVHTSTLPVEHL